MSDNLLSHWFDIIRYASLLPEITPASALHATPLLQSSSGYRPTEVYYTMPVPWMLLVMWPFDVWLFVRSLGYRYVRMLCASYGRPPRGIFINSCFRSNIFITEPDVTTLPCGSADSSIVINPFSVQWELSSDKRSISSAFKQIKKTRRPFSTW